MFSKYINRSSWYLYRSTKTGGASNHDIAKTCDEQSPQIRRLYIIKRKAAMSLPFDLHCKAIAALFLIPCLPVVLFEEITQ